MQIAFGRVRRKTAPTGSGGEDSIGKWRIECLCAKVFSFQSSVFSCQQLGVRSQPESFLQERAYDWKMKIIGNYIVVINYKKR